MKMCRALWVVLSLLGSGVMQAAESGSLNLRVTEKGKAGVLLPCRIHLTGPDGKAIRAPGLPFFRDHFSCEGRVDLILQPGNYKYLVARGPEYRTVKGSVTVTSDQTSTLNIALERWIHMARMNWYSGETHVHRPLDHASLLLRSEDLHVAPILTQWNQRNIWKTRPLPAEKIVRLADQRAYHVLGSEDERKAGALFFLNLDTPLDYRGAGHEYPSPVQFLSKALEQNDTWVEIEKPFWWDTPTWVATGEIDAIGLANNHMCRDTMFADEAWGRPRDARRLPPPRGNGFHTQEIYYRLLNCGFRIPPTAGSASGVLPNHVGYNRAYVFLGDEKFSYRAWFRGLAAGRSFVTNGPMLLVQADGQWPGAVLKSEEKREVHLDIRLDSVDEIEALEIIQTGGLSRRIETSELRGWHHSEPIVFEKSGWFLVRAIARVPHTFRFASTAPFYVEIGGQAMQPRSEDLRYFLQWIDERIDMIVKGKYEVLEDKKLEEVLAPHINARKKFNALLQSEKKK